MSSTGAAPAPASPHLKVSGSQFLRPDGRAFSWRGITAFRLLEMEAGGRGEEADAYLGWAAAERLTVVRVLVMAKHLFDLPPEKGVAALDALLSRAARHGVYVEVVALADTASYPLDLAAFVRRVGEICARHPNALLEIANEPYHSTQRAEVHDPQYLARLRAEVPAAVPVALGAGDYPQILSGADYVTVHFPRSIAHDGWGWVAALKDGARLVRDTGKPVIDDEPLGAGARFEPGRRDADPERFRAAAIAGRLSGLGSTFHYEGGLQARRPAGRELESFRAWQDAWSLVPGAEPVVATDAGVQGGPVMAIHGDGYAASFIGSRGDMAWVLIAGTKNPVRIEWSPGWSTTDTRRWPRSQWHAARRAK